MIVASKSNGDEDTVDDWCMKTGPLVQWLIVRWVLFWIRDMWVLKPCRVWKFVARDHVVKKESRANDFVHGTHLIKRWIACTWWPTVEIVGASVIWLWTSTNIRWIYVAGWLYVDMFKRLDQFTAWPRRSYFGTYYEKVIYYYNKLCQSYESRILRQDLRVSSK